MNINDSIFNEFFKSKKWKEIYDVNSLEVVISLIVTMIVSVLVYEILNNSSMNEINTIIRTLTKDIAISLMGLMGFLITGLAILISGISSKVMNLITERKKDKTMNKIFLGFYFEGLIIGILMVILLIAYIISFFDRPLNIRFCMVMVIILTYLVVFTIFYSVGLIGNCISVFRIVNNYSVEENIIINNMDLTEKDKQLYNELKIMVLEQMLIIQPEEFEKEKRLSIYIELLEGYINSVCKDENQKLRILNYFNKIYK